MKSHTPLDEHGQPLNSRFNRLRNQAKSLHTLMGILQGVVADTKLNEAELLFLGQWLRTQQGLFEDGDAIDLLDLISDVLKDDLITAAELDDLKNLINDIIDYKSVEDVGDEDRINELLGLLAGISSDDRLVDLEIEKLIDWINGNEDISGEWPIYVLVERINQIIDDGVITQEERNNLLDIIKRISGQAFTDTGSADLLSTDFLEEEVEMFDHEGTHICFTGKFISGTRDTVQKKARQLGAVIKRDVTRSLDVLVIGIETSRDWRFTSYGRKIEKALNLKKEGHNIIIMSERVWVDFL